MAGWTLAAEYSIELGCRASTVLRSRSLSIVDQKFIRRHGEFMARVRGHKLIVPFKTFALARELYGRQSYFASGLSIVPGETVVDLGANSGLFTVLACRLGAQCVAVEAQSGFVREIQDLLAANGCRAQTIWGIVGTSTGALSNMEALQESSHFQGKMPPSISMANILALTGKRTIDFLKCDIEGSEFDLFLHEKNWLSQVRKIAMEVHSQFGDPHELWKCLEENGFFVAAKNAQLQDVPATYRGDSFLYATRG